MHCTLKSSATMSQAGLPRSCRAADVLAPSSVLGQENTHQSFPGETA